MIWFCNSLCTDSKEGGINTSLDIYSYRVYPKVMQFDFFAVYLGRNAFRSIGLEGGRDVTTYLSSVRSAFKKGLCFCESSISDRVTKCNEKSNNILQ